MDFSRIEPLYKFKTPISGISEKIWNSPKNGIIITIIANLLLLMIYMKKMNLITLIAYLLLAYIIYGIIYTKKNKDLIENNKTDLKEDYEHISKEKIKNLVILYEQMATSLKKYTAKVISIEDPFYTICNLFYLVIINEVLFYLNEGFVFFLLLNVCIFYSPIDNRYPGFVAYGITSGKQIVEGIFGCIECIIPRYTEYDEKEEEKKKIKKKK